MPYRVPTNGRAVSVTYTALLNSQGSNNVRQFEFYLALMRETNTQYELIQSTSITTPNNIETTSDFASTIYSDSDIISPNFEVQEGDLFAVFVPNTCRDDTTCPAQVNLLNNGDCQFSLYFPSFATDAAVENISKNVTGIPEAARVRPVPGTVNIKVEIGKNMH